MEIWKIYKITKNNTWEISNYGNVKCNGVLYNINKNVKGYLKAGNVHIHRMVAELFVPNPENKPEIDHINTDKYDNRAINLRWVTREENMHNLITLQHCRNCKLGTTISDTHKLHISESHKGLSSGMKGKHKTEEQKQELSQLLKGRIHINNGEMSKMIKPEELQQYLDNGWIKGRINRRNTYHS